jgi:OOP family OmpA-OmpF porin
MQFFILTRISIEIFGFKKALQGIQFETGKAVIKPVSFPILKSIANVVIDNPTYKLTVEGHPMM